MSDSYSSAQEGDLQSTPSSTSSSSYDHANMIINYSSADNNKSSLNLILKSDYDCDCASLLHCCSQISYIIHYPEHLQYQGLIMVPITNTSAIPDIYLDIFILQLNGSSDVDIVNPFKLLTYLPSIITTSITNFTGFLHEYQPVFNQRDLPAVFIAPILVQVNHR